MFELLNNAQREWMESTFRRLRLEEKLGEMICEEGTKFVNQLNHRNWLANYPVGSMFLGAEVIDPRGSGPGCRQKSDRESRGRHRDSHALLRGL